MGNKRTYRGLKYTLAWLCLACLAFLFCFFVYEIHECAKDYDTYFYLKDNGVKVVATITEARYDSEYSDYTLDILYKYNGENYTHHSYCTTSKEYKVGDKIAVVIDPDNPSVVSVPTAEDAHTFNATFLYTATYTCFAVLSAYMFSRLLVKRKRKKLYADRRITEEAVIADVNYERKARRVILFVSFGFICLFSTVMAIVMRWGMGLATASNMYISCAVVLLLCGILSIPFANKPINKAEIALVNLNSPIYEKDNEGNKTKVWSFSNGEGFYPVLDTMVSFNKTRIEKLDAGAPVYIARVYNKHTKYLSRIFDATEFTY